MEFIPLGGDGFSAPRAAYSISGATVAGDVSGGTAGVLCSMDNRYCSLVSYCTGRINQATPADAELAMTIRELTSGRVPVLSDSGTVEAMAATTTSDAIARTWLPPPIICPGADPVSILSVLATNNDGDVFVMDAVIYLFDIRVREVTPMGPILWSRGSN